jgi:hypothetical protein
MRKLRTLPESVAKVELTQPGVEMPRAFGVSIESPKALDFLDFARFFAKNRFPLFRSAL